VHVQLARFKPVAEAISLLLFPHAEVVIHDLKTDSIAVIFNNLSKRAVGDPSLLGEMKDLADASDLFAPYFKMNWNGRKMKSVSSVLRDEAGNPIGLLCINLDISKWEEMHQFILQWMQPAGPTPEVLFKIDWREKINLYISSYLNQHALRLESLAKNEKKTLLLALQKEGAFESKNAASYIADLLNISRATVYNYLKDDHATPSI
jgi:predicted transcriptional regulator YheO